MLQDNASRKQHTSARTPKNNDEDHSAQDTILIRGKSIPVTREELAQKNLRFYPENPRVYSVLRADDRTPSQEEILEHLGATDHVKQLVQDIKRDGGLTDPVVVRAGTMEVLEGNSRLAAYRLLAEQDPIKWGKMRCMVLPRDVPDQLIFALLGQYHIKGKLAWEPYEKAGFLYRRYKQHGDDIEVLAKEIGMKKGEAEQLVRTYGFMVGQKDRERTHWSYYDEYLKSREIKKARSLHPELDGVFVDIVHNDGDVQAMDVRTKLAKVCKHPKPLQRLISGAASLHQAYQSLVDSGAEAQAYQKLKRFNEWFTAEATEKEITRSRNAERQRILLELKKLTRAVTKMNREVEKSR